VFKPCRWGEKKLLWNAFCFILGKTARTLKQRPGTGAISRIVARVIEKTMKMIQPNCRAQFAAEDIEFILSVLGGKIGTAECLVKLLADEESRDLILDDEALFHALLERRGCLKVSSRFYFYILVRTCSAGPIFRTARSRIMFGSADRVRAGGAGRCLFPAGGPWIIS